MASSDDARAADPAGGVDLEQMLDRIKDGFIAYDREWRIVYMNRAAEQYLLQSREKVLGRQLYEFAPQVRGTELDRQLKQAAARTEPSEFEVIAPIRGRYVACRAYPSAKGLTVYFTDINDRKLTEDALRDSEARYRALFNESVDGIALTAPDGRIFAANPAFCALLRMSEEEICRVGRSGILDLSDPRLTTFLEGRKRAGRMRGEVRLRRPDGTTVEVEVSSNIFHLANGEERTSMIIRDISERRRAQDRLELLARASEVLGGSIDYGTTIQAVAELAVPTVADMCFVDVLEDGQVRRLGGAHRDREKQALIFAVRHTSPSKASAGVERVLATGQRAFVADVTPEFLARAVRDPQERELVRTGLQPSSVLMVPLLDRGETIGVLTFATTGARRLTEHDLALAQTLADRASAAVQNARLYRSALEAKRLRDETLGVVAHDLRSPLNTIGIAASMLRRKLHDAQEVESIRASVARADALIQDLLTAAATDAGKLNLTLEEEAVGDVVEEAVTLHRTLAGQRGVQLAADVDPDTGRALLDRHRLVQLLSNLLGNALKFTEAGGQVTVHARRVGGSLELRVADTGHGIPEDQLRRLFDRFWQAPATKRGGAGLGLAIVKGIAEAHGGAVRVESQVGKGTTFTVVLPVRTREVHEAAPVLH